MRAIFLTDDRARYAYDAFNRTERVETFDGHVQVNHYDAEGLRHELEEDGKLVQFIYRGDEVVAEKTDDNIIRLIRGYDLTASEADWARTYYHYASDEMGSVTHVVTGQGKDSAESGEVSSGKVLNRYEYDAWGNLTVCEEEVENRFKFNGQQHDPITQQYYLRARYYNPVIARFTQEDTYRGDGLNLYAYCKNNPVYYEDPGGHSCLKEIYDKFKEYHKQGLTVQEVAYLATGRDNLSAAGRRAMGQYEIQKIMAEYQRLATIEYQNYVAQHPNASAKETGIAVHAAVASKIKVYLQGLNVNLINPKTENGQAVQTVTGNLANKSVNPNNLMPYITGVMVGTNVHQGTIYSTPFAGQTGGAGPDIVILYNNGNNAHVGDIKTGSSYSGSTYTPSQQQRNERK